MLKVSCVEAPEISRQARLRCAGEFLASQAAIGEAATIGVAATDWRKSPPSADALWGWWMFLAD